MASVISARALAVLPAVGARQAKAARRALEWLLLIALAALFLQRGLLSGWRTLNTDFPNYYLVARLYHSGYRLDRIYEWEWLQRQQDRLGGPAQLVGYAPHPPLCFTLMLPLAWLPALAAKRCWLLLNLLLLAAVVELLRRMTRLHWRQVSILVLLAVIPLISNFMFGQVYVVLLLLTTLALYCWLRSRSAACGLLLATGAALKLYPAAFVLYFVRKRQWRAAVALVLGMVASVAAAVWLTGVETVRTFGAEVLPRALRGDLLDPYNLRLNSVTVLVRHLLLREPELNPSPLAHLPQVYAIVQPVCLALLIVLVVAALSAPRRDAEREKIEWALFVALLLALSPIPASYHYVLLITPAVVAIDQALERYRRIGLALVGAYALICLPIPQAAARKLPNILNMPRLWGLLAFLVLVSGLLMASQENRTALFTKRGAVILAVLTGVFAAPGIWGNWRNLGQSAPGETVPIRPAWMATDPAVAGDRILFTAMTSEGYEAVSSINGTFMRLSAPANAYHPAVSASTNDVWIELSGRTSRIVQFDLNEGHMGRGEIADAEQPLVSPDARWLAFTRQQAGQSALWVTGLPLGERAVEAERCLTSAEFDVDEAAFMPDGTLVFAGRSRGGRGLFRVDPQAASPMPRLWISGAVRYPAVSPDGAWLAFSRREYGSWHLWRRNLATGEEVRITKGTCNAIAPAWLPEAKQLIYASDCGRGLYLTSLRRLNRNW